MQRIIGLAVVMAGCQQYDFVPVQPNAIEVQDSKNTVVSHPLAPNIMLVVDRSGSMMDTANGLDAGCGDANFNYTGRVADCKWNNLLDVLIGPEGAVDAGFLAALDAKFIANRQTGDPLPLGLAELPGPPPSGATGVAQACAAGTASVLSSISPSNEASITSALLGIAPAGGTPTAATLAAVGMAFPAQAPTTAPRANYIILMTDGAPNCDSSFVADASNCSGDRCTLGTCLNVPEGCLDEDNTVATIAQLYAGGIRTFVIGFGAAAIGGSSTETLQRMGAAGQGKPTSTAGVGSYYQASSAADLKQALTDILGLIQQNPCLFQLQGAPLSQALIEVLVTPSGGMTTTLASSQFTYDPVAETIEVKDATLCGDIAASGPTTPVTVEVRYLQQE